MDCSTLGLPVLYHLPEFAQIHVHWVSDAIQPSHPLLPPSPFALNLPKHQDLFQWVGSLQQVTKESSFSFSISLSDEYLGLISFRIDWFDLADQGTLKSLLQHHTSKAPIFQRSASSAFFIIQLSHQYNFYILSHYDLSQDIGYSSLYYTIGPYSLSILCI